MNHPLRLRIMAFLLVSIEKSLPSFPISFWAKVCVASIVLILSNGCATVQTDHPKNVIAIDSDGSLRLFDTNTPRSAIVKLTRNPAPRTSLTTNLYHSKSSRVLDFIFENNHALGTNKTILLFIQGGLNNVRNGTDRATRLSESILRDKTNPAYPIFIAWDANLFSAWGEQYVTHRGQNDVLTGVLLSPFTFVANAGRLVTRLPLSAYEQANAGAKTLNAGSYGKPRDPNERNWTRADKVNAQYRHLVHGGVDVRIDPSASPSPFQARGSWMIATAGPKIISEGVVESGGKVGWDFMLRRTKTMFTVANTFQRGGMEYFVARLVKYLEQHTEKRVVLIGHSMGAIVANELIRKHGDRLHISDIVYMAPACGVDSMDDIIIPFLAGHPDTQFYDLCLHPGNDSSELAYPATEIVSPRGSLLDWIDHYYSATETDYGWTLGKWDNVILGSKSFLRSDAARQVQSRIHIKAFGSGPKESHGPQHHGGFDQWKFWLEEFWKTLPYQEAWLQ